MILPDGWRQMDNAEATQKRTQLKPQTDAQKRFEDERKANDAILIIKHDTKSSVMAASVQVFYKPVAKLFEGSSAMDLTRMIARVSSNAFRGTLDAEPQEMKVSGLPGGTWSVHYDLVLSDGSKQPMFSRGVLVLIDKGESDLGAKVLGTPRQMMYMIGYSGPADDAADAATFDDVVKSIAIEHK